MISTRDTGGEALDGIDARRQAWRTLRVLLLVFSCSAGLAQGAQHQVDPFAASVQPFLSQHCYPCHGERKKAGLDLRVYQTKAMMLEHREVFGKVLENVRNREMPPPGRPSPSEEEREAVTRWLESTLFPIDCAQPDPGRVIIRRLNRTEYNHTLRDLVYLDARPADDFPADDSGYGFDNIGAVLSLPPVLLERYLTAAQTVLARALEPGTFGHERVFVSDPQRVGTNVAARLILERFVRRAWRRPPRQGEVDRLMPLVDVGLERGESFERSVRLALEASLVAPQFLFREEPPPPTHGPGLAHPVDEYALASRLSYFLWSSMPDEELFKAAERGTLRKNLDAQVRRMLKDWRAQALVHEFAGQWLQLRNLELVAPDAATYPAFDDELRRAMRRETELLFEHIVREDRSVLDFLRADYTFVNERLAQHYGIKRITGGQFRRVALRGTHRGGVLTHASILTLTSNPTRTSPVKRGKWVLDNLLGTPPPPPPPDVPELDTSAEGALTGTLRQRMEQHRRDPNCATCHARMDPLGFAFEHFDGIGQWREKDGAFTIDASGQLTSGERFKDAEALRRVLLKTKDEQFVRCLVNKMLTYALGRGIEPYDRCAIDQIVQRMDKGGHRFSTLVLGIVRSVPFQMRRTEPQGNEG